MGGSPFPISFLEISAFIQTEYLLLFIPFDKEAISYVLNMTLQLRFDNSLLLILIVDIYLQRHKLMKVFVLLHEQLQVRNVILCHKRIRGSFTTAILQVDREL